MTGVPGDHDVGAEPFDDGVNVHPGMQHVAGKDRLVEDEALVDLDDLHRLVAGVDLPHEVRLDQLPEDRDERRRRDEGVIPEFGGRLFIQSRPGRRP